MNILYQTVQNVLMLTRTYLLSAKRCRLKLTGESFDRLLLKETQLGSGSASGPAEAGLLLEDKTTRDRN